MKNKYGHNSNDGDNSNNNEVRPVLIFMTISENISVHFQKDLHDIAPKCPEIPKYFPIGMKMTPQLLKYHAQQDHSIPAPSAMTASICFQKHLRGLSTLERAHLNKQHSISVRASNAEYFVARKYTLW